MSVSNSDLDNLDCIAQSRNSSLKTWNMRTLSSSTNLSRVFLAIQPETPAPAIAPRPGIGRRTCPMDAPTNAVAPTVVFLNNCCLDIRPRKASTTSGPNVTIPMTVPEIMALPVIVRNPIASPTEVFAKVERLIFSANVLLTLAMGLLIPSKPARVPSFKKCGLKRLANCPRESCIVNVYNRDGFKRFKKRLKILCIGGWLCFELA